jgi:hypothetical protein
MMHAHNASTDPSAYLGRNLSLIDRPGVTTGTIGPIGRWHMTMLGFQFMTGLGQSTKMIVSVSSTKRLMPRSNTRPRTSKNKNHNGALQKYSREAKSRGAQTGCVVKNS